MRARDLTRLSVAAENTFYDHHCRLRNICAIYRPLSAIAVIPRTGCGPAGATNVWINSKNDQAFLPSGPCSGMPRVFIKSSIVLGELICPLSGWQNIAGLAPFERNDIGPAMPLSGRMLAPGYIGMVDCHSQFDCQKKELFVPITFVPESLRNFLILRHDMQPLPMFWSWSKSFGLVNSQKAGSDRGEHGGAAREQRGSMGEYGKSAREQMDETGLSAQAEPRGLSQQKVTYYFVSKITIYI